MPGTFLREYILAIEVLLVNVSGRRQEGAELRGLKATHSSRGEDGSRRVPRSLGRRQGPQVLQKLLAAGGRAVLVDDSLRLSHQELREQNAACFQDLCKTATRT